VPKYIIIIYIYSIVYLFAPNVDSIQYFTFYNNWRKYQTLLINAECERVVFIYIIYKKLETKWCICIFKNELYSTYIL